MAQVHCCGKVCVICKGAERVDGGVDEDAGEQAAAAIKNRDQQKADRDGKDDLAQVIDKIHAAAVEQVDDMPDTEGYAGDNNLRDALLVNAIRLTPATSSEKYQLHD